MGLPVHPRRFDAGQKVGGPEHSLIWDVRARQFQGHWAVALLPLKSQHLDPNWAPEVCVLSSRKEGSSSWHPEPELFITVHLKGI